MIERSFNTLVHRSSAWSFGRRVLDAALAPLYWFYARRLWALILRGPRPHHIALIIDGNRRFAEKEGVDVETGYLAGADRVSDVLRWSERAGIEAATLWALSVDNLQRPVDELKALTRVIEATIDRLQLVALSRGWRLRGIGRRDALPASLLTTLERAELVTADADRLLVQFAVGYGGREEILDALRRWAEQPSVRERPTGETLAQLSAHELRQYLYAPDLADPDLILRTSGELRLSGFLLWQSVYAEFYFTDVLWPEFREIDFLRALRDYQKRVRRFGR